MEKVKQKFSALSLKINCWSARYRINVLKLEYLSNALSFSQPVEISNKFTQFERNLRKFTGKLNSKEFRSMLPTKKANLIFKNTQDFNQTTHVGPQEFNVFTDNISLKIFQVLRLNTHFRMQNMCFSTRSFSTWIAQ